MSNMTPMMRQYHDIKAQHESSILLYRLGDFYELFFDDAIQASKILGLTLTKRGKHQGEDIPMAGIPFHAADGYVSRLIQAGVNVAICEQVGDPKTAKGPVKREVTQILTPGTLTDDHLLTDTHRSAVACLAKHKKTWGLGVLELSTGAFYVMSAATEAEISSHLARIQPSELLINEAEVPPGLTHTSGLQKRPHWEFDPTSNERLLKTLFDIEDLTPLGIQGQAHLMTAAGALVQYLKAMKHQALGHIDGLKVYHHDLWVQMDANTRLHLELTHTGKHSLFQTLNQCITPMGKRRLQDWIHHPIRDQNAIQQRQSWVHECMHHPNIEPLLTALKNVSDLERIASRLGMLTARPRDFLALRQTLDLLPIINQSLTHCPQWQTHHGLLPTLDECLALLHQAVVDEPPNMIRDGGFFKEGYDAQLDEYRSLLNDHHTQLAAIEQEMMEETGLNALKIKFNKVTGFYFELPKVQAQKAPDFFIRRQTLKNVERFTIPALKAFEDKVLSAESLSLAREKLLYQQLMERMQGVIQHLQHIGQHIATLDVIQCFASLATQKAWIQPSFCNVPCIDIKQGHHPILAEAIEHITPNSVNLSPESFFHIITGPNMGGKSTYMRQVALLTIMAHMGSFIPATSATFGPIDHIFTRIGAQDDIASGRSTFMVEMQESAYILHHATPNSLVILDEVGRGTSTYDGLAIAWAMCRYIAKNNRSLTLFATHYHELTELSQTIDGLINQHIYAAEEKGHVVFLHQIRPGASLKSFGINVARMAAMPKQVIKDAMHKCNQLNQYNPDQLNMFDLQPAQPQEQHPILSELSSLDLDDLTPRQAYELIRSWQEATIE